MRSRPPHSTGTEWTLVTCKATVSPHLCHWGTEIPETSPPPKQLQEPVAEDVRLLGGGGALRAMVPGRKSSPAVPASHLVW